MPVAVPPVRAEHHEPVTDGGPRGERGGRPAVPVQHQVHVHLAGTGPLGRGGWTSPAFRRRPTFLGLRLLFGIGPGEMNTTVDQDWAALASNLVATSQIDYGVALGFDRLVMAAAKARSIADVLTFPTNRA